MLATHFCSKYSFRYINVYNEPRAATPDVFNERTGFRVFGYCTILLLLLENKLERKYGTERNEKEQFDIIRNVALFLPVAEIINSSTAEINF